MLNGIGHYLNPIKTSYYGVVYKRDGVKHVAMTSDENPGELFIQIEFGQDFKIIKRLDPNVASKALGVFLALDGNYTKQFDILAKKIRQ